MTGLDASLPRIAILGAGHVGPIVARLAAAAGYPVSIATSGDPEDIALTIQVLAPGVVPHWVADAVADADVVVLAIPLHRFGKLDPDLLAGKIVVDMMNYWPEVNGFLAEFNRRDLGSSELVARRLADSRVVKTFNHLGYHQIDEESRASGDPDRRALGVAGDDPAAVALVSEFVERVGFDPVPVGGLAAGRMLEPDGPVFGTPMSRPEFERSLGGVPA
jgi:predicted dinucleotide-binding enzyme